MNNPSEETLVEWDRVDANAIFTFSRDDMRRTTLSLRGFGPSYTVDGANIHRYGERVPVAVVELRGLLPDRIVWGGKERVRVRRWLKFSTLTMFPVTFEAHGKTYVWRSTAEGRLSLHLAPLIDSPIAWFTPSRTLTTNGPGIHTTESAYLTLRPLAIEIQDLVIVSFLILEHKSRTASPLQGQGEAMAGGFVYYCEFWVLLF
ncbi:hypothetical protein FPV67DRAFT_991911 [Lyophyllum atratum]|nr:hypothetical protein FPV67DRAFT_991911 [Lyophyllum atratum]